MHLTALASLLALSHSVLVSGVPSTLTIKVRLPDNTIATSAPIVPAPFGKPVCEVLCDSPNCGLGLGSRPLA
ncbi:hypothetical protein FB451DRAFT_1396925 [Mycena latifolia]|nr:hypothetical protein FB451DRAFT_1396925 [Mycena latifolia]